MDFFFDGHWRLDIGLGNPNKTAVLISCLLVLSVYLARWRSHSGKRTLHDAISFAAFLTLFAVLGGCLIHTYSRGGILAAVAGLLAAWLSASRGRIHSCRRATAFAAVCLGLILYSTHDSVRASDRFLLSAGEDRSIGNRLILWSAAPRMMVDAPEGWGIGRSGDAWTQWYQSDDTRYEYRTMVNSHLTWLIEFGWIGRFLYLFAWGIVLRMCWPRDRSSPGAGIALGLWVAFAVGAVFSSVAEAPLLWVLPLAGLVMSPCSHSPSSELPPVQWRRDSTVIGLLSTLALLVIALFGRTPASSVNIHFSDQRVQVSTSAAVAEKGPSVRSLIAVPAPDRRILGSHYGRAIRNHLLHTPTAAGQSWWVSETGKLTGSRPNVIVLSGDTPPEYLLELSPASWLAFNPTPASLEILTRSTALTTDRTARVFLGTARRDQEAANIRSMVNGRKNFTLVQVTGFLHFIPHWPKLVGEHFITLPTSPQTSP